MENDERSFRAFEQAGWEDATVVAGYDEYLSALTTQSIDVLLEAVAIGDGSRLLDVATGPGYVAHAAAQLGAAVIGVDFSASQVHMAREKYPTLRFEQADAQALPFEADSFDAVVCAFGMCHFPQPRLALSEAFRVLRPGGRIAFSVWDVPERAIGFGAVYDAIRAHGSMDVGLPVGPNFFMFSDPAQCNEALSAAGFVSPSFRSVPQVWRMTHPDAVFDIIAGVTVRAAATLRRQEPGAIEAIKAAVRETVMRYKYSNGYEVPTPAVLAAAVKP
jgi:ubiquinone/menaquinone biosynthesis C-methylase UbiE